MKKETRVNKQVILTGLVTSTILTGCGDSSKKWENAPGTKGFINLDAVKAAFTKNQDITKFETRVNEIFEGDNLIVFKIENKRNGFKLLAKEDINKDKLFDSEDDLIFTLTASNGRATLKGAGVNKYYKKSWLYSPKDERTYNRTYHGGYYRSSFWWWYWGRPYGSSYYTSYSSYDNIRKHRDDYRNTDGFKDQVKKNCSYEKNMRKRHGSSFINSVSSVSSTRSTYISKNTGKISGKSGWTVRSTSKSMSSSFGKASVRVSSGRGWGGSFRGFGGAKV